MGECGFADAGVAQECEEGAGIGIPVGEARDARRDDLGAGAGLDDRGVHDVGELGEQRLVRPDAAEQHIAASVAVLQTHLHPGLAGVDREHPCGGHAVAPCVLIAV